MKLTKTDETAWRYGMETKGGKKTELNMMFLGCSHMDSVWCNREKLKECLDIAKENDARIVFNGDNNDMMQGRHDRRSSYQGLREEFFNPDTRSGSYLNDVINSTVEFLSPYADNIDIFGLGNHEMSVIKNMDIDVTSIIANDLQRKTDHRIYVGGLEGFIRVVFNNKGNKKSASKLIHFRHDGGSCGKRTKGILAYDLLAAEYTNADIFITAHTHDMVTHETKCTQLNKAGRYEYPERLYLQSPSFKEEFNDRSKRGWWIATNKGARATGGFLVKISATDNGNINLRTRWEFVH